MSLAQRLGLGGATNIPKRFAPFYNQAASEALVRYQPQYDALEQLRAQSADQMRSRVAQARTAGAIASNSAALAAKALGEGPNAQAPAIQSVIGILGQRAADAPIAANQQIEQAMLEHANDLDKIHAQRASLLNQIGTFTIGRATDLVGADRKLRHDVNQQQRQLEASFKTAGVDPVTGHIVKGGPKDPHVTQLPKPKPAPSTIAKAPSWFTGSDADWNKLPRSKRDALAKQHAPKGKGDTGVPNPGNIQLLPPGQQATQVTRINGAYANIQELMSKPGAHPAEIAHGLRAGFVDGVKYTQDQIDVAFDRFRNKGRVSNRGAHKLHTMGVSVAGHFHPAKPKPKGQSISTGVGGSIPLPPGVNA